MFRNNGESQTQPMTKDQSESIMYFGPALCGSATWGHSHRLSIVRKSPKAVNSQTFATFCGAMMGSYLWARATSPPSALRGLLTDSYIMFCIYHCSNTTQFLCIMFCIYHNLFCVVPPFCDSVVPVDPRSPSQTLNREKVKLMTKTHQNLRLKLHHVR